ncbi:hypothetical protein HDV63DRAFT_260250 [Trichoderma sp. SZMC 28014]
MPANLHPPQSVPEPFSKAGMVFDWYRNLPSRRIDLFGDYAGNELFLIEFDSLLLHCFSEPNIDFGTGFQLLHAVYVVEKLLSDLLVRKCRFQIVCFHQNELLCIPTAAHNDDAPKYRLARAVIMHHFSANVPSNCGIEFHRFESLDDKEFRRFLDASDAYFVMIHDGAVAGQLQGTGLGSILDIFQKAEEPAGTNTGALTRTATSRVWLRVMIAWFLTNQYNVALINEVQLLDNKILTTIFEHAELKKLPEATFQPPEAANLPYLPFARLQAVEGLNGFSGADLVTLLALQSSLTASQISKDNAALMLLHTAALFVLPLGHRYLPVFSSMDGYKRTVSSFTQSALSVVSSSACISQLEASDVSCNLVDLVDGRLLATIMADHDFRSALLTEDNIMKKFDSLCAALTRICGVSISIKVQSLVTTKREMPAVATPSSDGAILSFKNTVLERHLDPLHLKPDDEPVALTPGQTQIFKELSYWRRQAKAPVSRGLPVRIEREVKKHALTQNQNLQKEIQVYAASLTNASGKILEPQIIVSGSFSQNRKSDALKPAKQQKPADASSNRSKRPGNKKGGKLAALEAAAEIKAIAMKPKSDIKTNFWRAKCKEFLTEEDLISRHNLGLQYLQSLNKADELGPEVQLFTVDCLFRIIVNGKTSIDQMSIAALIWDSAYRLSTATSGITPNVAIALEGIVKSLSFPGIDARANAPSRPLAFSCLDPKALQNQYILPHGGPIEFQLEHCGPYLDRAIDSAADSRVRFEPDGWQRSVLDAIDNNQSLFVTAPTSAGKTFISFYAMEKVLQADDDGVLAYVAPTTALVNQIAAEIHGRFSKSYKHAGRSVWAIHTRDYRINNPTGCQILVTVPRMLQNMLLTPSHAEKKNSWSTRIRRIIFDEIHCIGQAKDGIVWEQLLLQAPCPIIALSATVGNPRQLSDWLSSTERANANDLVTVQHHYRYSSLRNFIYVPPKEFCFSGLPALPDIYIPGLDGSLAFGVVHPVASLVNKEKGLPSDLSLEARDCLRLWRVMSQHATEKHSLPHALHPDEILPQLIKKMEVIHWEAELKGVLRQWMLDDSSPFDLVRRDLGSSLQHLVARDIMSTSKHGCDEDCSHRKVDPDSITSTILPVLVDLHAKGALPCIVFNYDRIMCETLAHSIVDELGNGEAAWKASKTSWQKKLADYHQYRAGLEIARSRAARAPRKEPKRKKKRGEDDDDDEKVSRAERVRELADADVSVWAGFNPDAPIDGFHFADITKLTVSELVEFQSELRGCKVPEWLVCGLERGVGVHHSGMNPKYLQIVEVLFRKGFMRVVLATGTLALGINMPCRTVVFAGDSISLTALNFRQAAGRAGRRGFDVLGNVVFVGIPTAKVFRLLSSRLPDLTTQYPINTSFILRLAALLHGSNNSPFALRTIDSIFSRPHLHLGLPESGTTVRHHLRFSIEYLRRQLLLDTDGAPINFANCISSLHHTGNSVWAFHALLSKGYFHELCKDIDINPERVLVTLMLVLSHIFERQLCKHSDIEFVDDGIKRSSSIVFLPPLPRAAKDALSTHDAETLSIFKVYAKSYIDQYLHHGDDKLPLTRLRIGSDVTLDISASACTPSPVVRSPFVALSGHGDEFSTISELCNTVRSGVFLEEAIVPHLRIYLEESDPPLNAYLLDFFKHGDIETIKHANKIQESEVLSRLKDFATILHTIVACLADLTKSRPLSNKDDVNIQSDRDALGVQHNGRMFAKQEADSSSSTGDKSVHGSANAENSNLNENSEGDWYHDEMSDKGLLRVLRAFAELHGEFEAKLKKIAV